MTADATDLGYIRLRLARTFMRRPVLAFHGLQYRLSEVGPYRFDSRQLDHALSRLPRSVGRFSRSRISLYVDPTIDKQKAADLVKEATQTLSDIARINYSRELARASRQIARVLRSKSTEEQGPDATPTPIGLKFALPRASTIIRSTNRRGPPIICWLTHELPMLYPDDPRLWEILDWSVKSDSIPLIVARKLASVTFPFLKAIGGYGLQYHLPVSDGELANNLSRRADDIGWPPFQAHPGLRAHPILARISDFTERTNEPGAGGVITRGGKEAITDGIARGFSSTSRVSADSLLSWAEASQAVLPSRWIQSIETWASRNEREVKGIPTDLAETPELPEDLTENRIGLREPSPRSATVVTHGLVPAEVDRETWNEILQKIATKKSQQRSQSS